MPDLTRTAIVGASLLVPGRPTPSGPSTVVVEGERVVAVEEGVHVPAGADVIDASGAWLMPGLIDMHAHMWDDAQGPSVAASGITTIRDMWGSALSRRWRGQVEDGSLAAPSLVCASPLLEGRLSTGGVRYPGVDPVDSAADAERRVHEHAAAGFDAIKVYSGLDEDRLAAACATAREHGLPVVGHVPSSMTIADAVRVGMHGIEHVTEWQNDCLVPGTVVPPTLSARVAALESGTDWDAVRRLADTLRDAGTTVCPTLRVWGVMADAPHDHEDDPAMRLAPSVARALWSRNAIRPAARESAADVRASALRLRALVARVVAVLHEHEVRLVVGTDAGSIWTVAGPSYADELTHLRSVLPAEAVLEAATSAAALDLGDRGPGLLRAGGRADLLVVDENPLEDVTAPTRARVVMSRGRVQLRAELDAALDLRASTVDAALEAPDDELGPMGRRAWFARGLPTG